MPGIGIGLGVGFGGGTAWNEADIARTLVGHGLTDISARAAIGGAASLAAGLRTVGLLPPKPAPSPPPTAAVTPLPAGIAAMWDAASLSSLADGAAVTHWTDTVGGSVAADAGDSLSPHIFVADSGGGLPAVRLSGAGVLATSGTNAAATAMTGQDRTILVVVRNFQDLVVSNGNVQTTPGMVSSGSNDPTMMLVADTTHTGTIRSATGCADAGMRTIAYSSSGSRSIGMIGVNGTAISGPNRTEGGQVYIGGWQNRSYQCCGRADVLAVIIWNRALTAAELKQVHRRYCELVGQARPGGAGARIVSCIGDSLTAGYTDGLSESAQLTGSYPYQMAMGLGLPWGTWDQMGYLGDNLPLVLSRTVPSLGNVSAATGTRSIVCFFEFANTRQSNVGATSAAARSIIDALAAQDGNRDVVLGTSTDDGSAVGVSTRQNRSDYDAYWDNPANRSGVAAYVPLHLDTNIGVQGAAPTDGNGNGFYQTDGLHFKTAGYALIDNGPHGFRSAVRARLAA